MGLAELTSSFVHEVDVVKNWLLVAVASIATCGAVAAATSGAVSPQTKGVYRGVITVGHGAGGIRLGMTRAQVIATLGRPFSRNSNGYMQYAKSPRGMFDVYLTSGRVQMLGIAQHHRGFRLSDGNQIFLTGGLARLMDRYGRRLKLVRLDDGERVYRITGRLRGRTVWTDFLAWPLNRHGIVEDVFLLFAPRLPRLR